MLKRLLLDRWLRPAPLPTPEPPRPAAPARGDVLAEAAVHLELGQALQSAGKPAEALAAYARAIKLKHDYVDALNAQAVAYLNLGRLEEAEDSFNLAVAFDPGSAGAYFGLGLIAGERGSDGDAQSCFARAAELDPGMTAAHIRLGMLAYTRKRYADAVAHFERAAALEPGLAELQSNLGLALQEAGRSEEAIACLRRAVELKDDLAEAHFNLGSACHQAGRLAEAEASYHAACRVRPAYAEAYSNLGNVHRDRGALDQALACYERAIALEPKYAEAHYNAGVALHYQGRTSDAIGSYETACAHRPGYPEARLNLALARLTSGDLARGWEGYDSRFEQPDPDNRVNGSRFSFPLWRGEPLAGKRIAAWGEQGIGDELMCAQMYADVIRAARQCVVECAPKLQPLFARSFPGATVVARSDPPHAAMRQAFDFHSPAGSLARYLRPGLDSFPDHRGYLAPDPSRVAYWRERLAALGPGLKVGFSWRSNNLKGDRALSCARIEQWEPVLRTPGARFVSLQYDECSEELARAAALCGAPVHAFPEVDLFNDLDEAAALTRALDLVISAPTAVAVLAAALGVATWQASYGPDWQTLGTQRNPWFPAMVRYTRAWYQAWEPTIDRVAEDLRRLIESAPWRSDQVEALVALGDMSHADGRHGDAFRYRKAAAALVPDDAGMQYNIGIELLGLNRIPEALARFHRAVELDPGLCEAHLKLGELAMRAGAVAPAIASYGRAIALNPRHAGAHNNIASAYAAAGALDKALESVRASLALEPDHPEALCNMGIILQHQGRMAEAIDFYLKAQALKPDAPETELNLGIARLMNREFAPGWEGYEWRFRANGSENRLLTRGVPGRTWRGEDLAGKTILVWGEQGVGDQLLFASLVPEISRAARHCVIECAPKLVPLLARSFPAANVVPLTDPPHPAAAQAFDYQTTAGSIARWRRPDLASFPVDGHYLAPDPERVAHWRRRLAALAPRPVVGISWRSIKLKGERALSCTSLEQWGPVFAATGALFVSLQYDECSAELSAAAKQFGVELHAFPEVDLFNDLDEAAALTRGCDLVISAPTAVSILAAAVGVPTWQMSYGPDWQTHGTGRNPWLPALVRFERPWQASWEEIMPKIARALQEWLGQHTAAG